VREIDRPSEDVPELDAAGSPEETREIEALVSLLRSLPDPEPRADLTARVMARVMEIEAQPRGLARIRWIPTSRSAAALAASLAVVAIGIGLFDIQPSLAPESGDPVARSSAMPPRVASATRTESRRSLSLVSAYPGRPTAFFGRGVPGPALQSAHRIASPDQHLDAQLNELQLDPQAFFRRLERVQDRDRFIQRLAERAARRGDAAQVGLRVRSVQHRLAPPMGERFLQASLVQQIATRR
jgi:hypothetical protein